MDGKNWRKILLRNFCYLHIFFGATFFFFFLIFLLIFLKISAKNVMKIKLLFLLFSALAGAKYTVSFRTHYLYKNFWIIALNSKKIIFTRFIFLLRLKNYFDWNFTSTFLAKPNFDWNCIFSVNFRKKYWPPGGAGG